MLASAAVAGHAATPPTTATTTRRRGHRRHHRRRWTADLRRGVELPSTRTAGAGPRRGRQHHPGRGRGLDHQPHRGRLRRVLPGRRGLLRVHQLRRWHLRPRARTGRPGGPQHRLRDRHRPEPPHPGHLRRGAGGHPRLRRRRALGRRQHAHLRMEHQRGVRPGRQPLRRPRLLCFTCPGAGLPWPAQELGAEQVATSGYDVPQWATASRASRTAPTPIRPWSWRSSTTAFRTASPT